jgi:uncharacterized membrane protein
MVHVRMFLVGFLTCITMLSFLNGRASMGLFFAAILVWVALLTLLRVREERLNGGES